jgi:hypothetical protein
MEDSLLVRSFQFSAKNWIAEIAGVCSCQGFRELHRMISEKGPEN